MNKRIQTIFPLAVLFAALVLAMPRNSKLSYEYKVGQPWKYETLIAPFDFPILKTEEQITEELAQNSVPSIPYYRFSSEIENRNLSAAAGINLGSAEKLRISIISNLSGIYEKGVVGDEGIAPVSGGRNSEIIYLQRDKRAVTRPVSEVYKLSDARAALLAGVSADNPGINADSVLSKNGIYDLLTPNLLYDRELSELIGAENSKSISPTLGLVNAGQLIVSTDEIVTPEIVQMLNSYTIEYQNNISYGNRPAFLFWLGNGIIALAIVLLIFFAIYFASPEIFSQKSLYLYILLILGVFLLAAIIMPRIESGLIYLVPFTLCALLLEPFLDNRLIYMLYAAALLPLLFFSESPVVVYTLFFVGGIVSVYTFRHFRKGWQQFLNALITYAVMMAVYLGLRFIDVTGGGMLRISVYLFAASMLPVAGFPLTYLLERIFNLVSDYRLSELADNSNPLLQELEKKAPGSFQHSLQVMNMADYAARSIGADTLLVRVGAMYHDIGKIRNPLCFVENESMINSGNAPKHHEGLEPLQSAKEIIRHIEDGVEIAAKYHIPKIVVDFIRTHHGTTRTGYFYNKYVNAGGNEADAPLFCYPGPRPQTREQVVLMLCDSVEAAARTLKEYTAEAFDEAVERIFADKAGQAQFDRADISYRDLVKLKESIKNYLTGVYHERIEYPKLKDKNEDKQEKN